MKKNQCTQYMFVIIVENSVKVYFSYFAKTRLA